MFRKLLLVGGFDMVQLIHITNGPIYLSCSPDPKINFETRNSEFLHQQ